MNTYLVTMAVENGNPSLPPDMFFYAVSAKSREAAEKRVTADVHVQIVAVASRALPSKWPSYDGEVIVI